MTVKRGTATKAIVDAINAAGNEELVAADITDSTATGRTLLTAANAGAARTALSVAEKVAAPASASAAGSVGQWAADSGYIYIATGASEWKRVAIATWP